MATNLGGVSEAIREHIHKLQRIDELVCECEKDQERLVAFLRDTLLGKGEIHRAHKGTATMNPKRLPHPNAHNGNGHRPHGYLLLAIRGALKTIAKSEFTSEDVTERLQASGFEFKAKKPKVAVNEALGTLATKGVVKKVRNEGVSNIWAKTGSAAA